MLFSVGFAPSKSPKKWRILKRNYTQIVVFSCNARIKVSENFVTAVFGQRVGSEPPR